MSDQQTHQERLDTLCKIDMPVMEHFEQIIDMAQELAEKLDAVMGIVNTELDLMSGHEGTDDWFCTRSRSWFVIEDLEINKDDYGVGTVQCPCCEEPSEHLDLIMSPHAELAFDALEAIKKAIAEATK